MKKTVYPILMLISLALACTNENSVNPRPTEETVSKVKITGRVRAELNNTINGLENVPDDMKIVVAISSKDLVLEAGEDVTYVTKYYEALTKGGLYTVEVEVGPNGSKPTINFPSFRFDVVLNNTTSNSTLFPASSRVLNPLVKGQDAIFDYTYTF